MEHELCLPEEYRGGVCNGDRPISQVIIRDFDEQDRLALLVVLRRFWIETMGEDTGFKVTIPTVHGNFETLEVEARLSIYLWNKAKIKLALSGGKIVGYLLYQEFFGGTLIVHHLWTDLSFRGKFLGKGLVDSVGGVKMILFQTSLTMPPEKLLGSSKNYWKLYESNGYATWRMDWE